MNADYHVHTAFSDDSDCPMEDMVRRALELGLDELAFTEHVDYGVKTDENCDYARYAGELERVRAAYRGRITLRKGIEFGVQEHTCAQYRTDAARERFDFIILSCHEIGDKEFWNNAFQPGKTQEQIHRAYYEALLAVMEGYTDYSVLGHLDLIKRYDPYGDWPDDNVMPLVDAILRRAISDGKGIEINTSCFRYGLKDLTPSRRILVRYHELGGRILTFGSDAHEARHLADHFGEVRRTARDLGFTEHCTFRAMEPQFHPL